MMWKFAIAIAVAWAGWWLWRGPARRRRAVAAPAPGGEQARMARALLGVSPGASAREIRAAHRRLMARAHPDHGGSADDAQALNAARDLLLGPAG